jgi:hypothetical protein
MSGNYLYNPQKFFLFDWHTLKYCKSARNKERCITGQTRKNIMLPAGFAQ